MTAPHVDDGNKASVTAGESVELLGTWDAQQWLVRLFEQPSKVSCVIITQALLSLLSFIA